MTVYVGPSQYPYGRMIMCHMTANSFDELHKMAARLGVRRWFQDGRMPHYDISKSRRKLAVHWGAIETDERRIVEVAKRCANGKN
jgi:hypothetical protein